MPPPADDVGPGFRLGLTGLLIAIATFGVVDIILDKPTTWMSVHILLEVAYVLLSLGSVVFLWSGWARTRRSLSRVEGHLETNRVERDEWKSRATQLLVGLGTEIDAQLERWSLTPAEKQVALLLLKGLGHREAAEVLDRSERTVRQHAVAIYRKSGLAGRAELSAFFLEDLLLPTESAVTSDAGDVDAKAS